ncbi:cupin domain-containing protein [uncultured Bradyrhizobium sp.]|uniref:cupin domain-containing protein n=1 Tax=uncultured Bradyrhizobium sp. TaxID=199684 RepID=UPI0035CB5C80
MVTREAVNLNLDEQNLVRRGDMASFTDEYNCKLRRLYPWPGVVETKRPMTEFGAIWAIVEPGKTVDSHSHDEEETFIVIGGCATLKLDGQTTTLQPGDVAYIPRFARHELQNRSATEPFVFVNIYWDLRSA